ncbi:MAG: hypothetical protein K0B09_14135 [Bacteroidales bacterium]|nr:hypothetical protein [Bacteroidales bacterium]
MEFRPVKIQNSLLTEGQSYPFRLLGKMELGRGEEFFVLRDPLGYKMLMPAGYYQSYGFAEGQEIICRVDKINCNGRMFLEPQNPWYKEGELYEFEVLSHGHRENIAGNHEWYYVVKDRGGRPWRVKRPVSDGAGDIPESVTCRIERIKKGQLYLQLEGAAPEHRLLKNGETYAFTIAEEKVNPDDGFAYYILEESSGKRFLLRKKYYVNYRLKKGQPIKCRVDGTMGDGYPFLEPFHPHYQTGEVYDFPVDRLEEYIFSDGTRQKVMVLKDKLGEEIKVRVDEEAAIRWAPFRKLSCRVQKIRKSRLEVEILQGVEPSTSKGTTSAP